MTEDEKLFLQMLADEQVAATLAAGIVARRRPKKTPADDQEEALVEFEAIQERLNPQQ